MSRRWPPSLLLLLLAACGATTPTDPAAPPISVAQPAPAPAYSSDLERAARLAREAEAVEPPPVPRISDKAASLSFLNERVKPWIQQRRDAVERADEAYSEVISRLPELEVAKVAFAQGNLMLSFFEDFMNVTVAAAPPEIAADDERMTAYRGAVLDAARVQLEQARAAFERCIFAAGRARGEETSSLCRSRLARLPSPTPKRERKEPRPTVEDQPRPLVPTRQLEPCVFAGTLRLWRAPLTLERGGSVVAHFDRIEIEQLTLPPRLDEPLRVSTVWPVRGTFLLEQKTLPFELRSKVELVLGHIWLSAGAAVRAVNHSPRKATVSRPEPDDEKRRSTPAPVKVVPCSELTLAGHQADPSTPTDGEFVRISGEVPLSKAPQAPPLGVLRLRDSLRVRVLARHDDWMRITSSRTPDRKSSEIVAYDFDAWTNASPTQQGGFAGGVLALGPAPATHEVTAELDISNAPNAKPFAKLAIGVALLAGETRDGFVEVSVPSLRPGDFKQWGFWVPEPDFRKSTRALSSP